ncbi:MAG: serine/threonine-protein kinase [Myxococcota bacterium]
MPILTAEERIGSTLAGKYRLQRIIGRGGMGVVFAGLHEWTGREVAIKLLHAELAAEPMIGERFLREARTAAQLRHPNVVDVLDMQATDEREVFLVLELLQGRSLEDVIKQKGALTEGETLAILNPIMDALADAHALGIIHRDLKPDNVFLHHDPKRGVIPKLLDFGIAKIANSRRTNSTGEGTIIGTPTYMSPEQALGMEDVGPASDVWSMGAMLFECIGGRPPFLGPTPTAVLTQICTAPAPALGSIAATAQPGVTAAIDRALVRERSERYPDMTALRNALREAITAPTLSSMDDYVADIATATATGPFPVQNESESSASNLAFGATEEKRPGTQTPMAWDSQGATAQRPSRLRWVALTAMALLATAIVATVPFWLDSERPAGAEGNSASAPYAPNQTGTALDTADETVDDTANEIVEAAEAEHAVDREGADELNGIDESGSDPIDDPAVLREDTEAEEPRLSDERDDSAEERARARRERRRARRAQAPPEESSGMANDAPMTNESPMATAGSEGASMETTAMADGPSRGTNDAPILR